MTLAHTAPTLLDGSHVLAFLAGAAVCGVVARLVVLYAEREAERSDDLAPIPYRNLPPRSVPPTSAHSMRITHMAVSQDTSTPSPNPFASQLRLYDVERDEPRRSPRRARDDRGGRATDG